LAAPAIPVTLHNNLLNYWEQSTFLLHLFPAVSPEHPRYYVILLLKTSVNLSKISSIAVRAMGGREATGPA
jgi:hypothetical protein